MEELDLKERIYDYYTILRQELNTKVKFTNSGKVKGIDVNFDRARSKNKTIKWRSKGY